RCPPGLELHSLQPQRPGASLGQEERLLAMLPADGEATTEVDVDVGLVSGMATGEEEQQLQEFLQRFPMDERASGYLGNCSQEVKLKVITTFDPRNKSETDYSRQVTGYIRS
ncbi:unnamed protein product, partial [Polarella glacialis]